MAENVQHLSKIGIEQEPQDLLKANAFVRPNYRPRNAETKEIIEKFLKELGLEVDEKRINAMASVLVASRMAHAKGETLIAYPGDSGYYTKGLYGRRVAIEVRDRLIGKGHLIKRSDQRKGQAIVYEAVDLDLEGAFTSSEAWPVRVRELKELWEEKGKSIPRPQCLQRYRQSYRVQEKKIERLNGTYARHPLTSPNRLSWGGVFRGFNEGRLDRGGRLYGDWQSLKEAERLKLTIDSEPLVEIDIVASALSIVSAKAGCPIVEQDPYSSINWVKDKQSRDLAKRLISAMISKRGPRNRFPKGVRIEFGISDKQHLDDFQEPILDRFPQLRHPSVSGMEAMFIESEAILGTIEALIAIGIVAYPVHDCLLVAEKHKVEAISELSRQLDTWFEATPWLKVTYGDGREEYIDPTSAFTFS